MARWPEAVPLRSITAKLVGEVTLEIFSRMGLPVPILTDRGTQFSGSLMKHLTSELEIDDIYPHYSVQPLE